MGPSVGLDQVKNIEASEYPANKTPITRSMSP